MVRRSRRRPAFRVLAYSTAAALVAVGLTSVAAAADPEPVPRAAPTGTATGTASAGTATSPPVTPSTRAPTSADGSSSTSPTSLTPTSATTTSPAATTPTASTPASTPASATPPTPSTAPRHATSTPQPGAWLRHWPPTRSTTGSGTGRRHGGLSAARSAAAWSSPAARYRHTSTGHISWSARTGAWETLTAVDARFQTISGPSGALGFPYTAPMGIAGGQWQWFEHGVLWLEQRHRSVGDGRLDQRPLPRHQRAVHSRLPHQGRRADRRRLVAVVHRRGDLVQPVDGGVGDLRLHQRPVPRDQRSVDARIPDRHRESPSPVGVGSGSPEESSGGARRPGRGRPTAGSTSSTSP